MGFNSRRGRPRKPAPAPDFGTPELRLKHALGLTIEPIDLCLERNIITEAEHKSGLHLRWLHTLRYGAPRVTMRYAIDGVEMAPSDDPTWRALREHEYAEAVTLLRARKRHDIVIRVTVHNEIPPFLDPGLLKRVWDRPALEATLTRDRQHFREGLKLLQDHWKC